MFERYTEKARRVIFFARYEASQFGSPYIESEHLLLGLLREDKALTNRFLRSHSSVESIRKQIEGHTTVREKVSTSVDLPLSDECKRILPYAADESERLHQKHIGTEHLLLGILREQGCFAAQLLEERGISLENVRENIRREPPQEAGPGPKSQGIPAGYAAQRLLYNTVSEALIVEMRSLNQRPSGRLFVRRKDAEAYEQIGDPSEIVSYESPVTCEKHPIIVFNSKESSEEGHGRHWAGVYSYNLNTKELFLCIAKGSLVIPEPHLRSWITELISLSDDAETLYCNLAIEKEGRPKQGGGALPYGPGGGATIDHRLASVNLKNNKLELLFSLKDVRF